MTHLLDNIVWHTLAGPHVAISEGTDTARRYGRGFTPLIGFVDPRQPDFAALTPCCDPGEHFYCDGWAGEVSAGWRIARETTMFKMIWAAPMPARDQAPDALRMDARHAAQALDLAVLTNPGPFGLRTLELGEYFGFFAGDRLLAMAGERLFAGSLREISGVCTHPDFQGRGLARRLMGKLIRRQMMRGETPFLHVVRENTAAHSLYQRMGFRDYRESPVRVVSRLPPGVDN